MIWVEGEIVADDALRISVRDRTFEHGIGLFETLRTWNGHPTLLRRHTDRMERSARELGLFVEYRQLPDARAVSRLIAACEASLGAGQDLRLRVTLSGGLTAAPAAGSVVWMTAEPLPLALREPGAVITQSIEVARDDPLARHKTLNYWRKRLAHAQALAAGSDDVLCLTPDRFLCEASRSNIFLVRGRRLYTPSLGGPLLPGVMRAIVLDRAARIGLELREEPLALETIATADESFLANSVRGIVPVRRLLDVMLPAPGPTTRQLWDDILPWLESGGLTP
jgi:branched-subunit amino acid aminotransferase/4-amino-4-deoxychorismate lyase